MIAQIKRRVDEQLSIYLAKLKRMRNSRLAKIRVMRRDERKKSRLQRRKREMLFKNELKSFHTSHALKVEEGQRLLEGTHQVYERRLKTAETQLQEKWQELDKLKNEFVGCIAECRSKIRDGIAPSGESSSPSSQSLSFTLPTMQCTCSRLSIDAASSGQ